MEASAQDPAQAIARALGALWWLWLAFGAFWIAVARLGDGSDGPDVAADGSGHCH